jgi:hypothetical protein
MRTEGLGPGEIEDAEFNRLVTERELKKGGAQRITENFEDESASGSGAVSAERLSVTERQVDTLHQEGERHLETIRMLEGEGYQGVIDKLSNAAVEVRVDYMENRGNLKVKINAEREFGQGALSHKGEEPYHNATAENEWQLSESHLDKKGLERMGRFVNEAMSVAELFALRVPFLKLPPEDIMAHFSPSEILDMIGQARDAALYKAKVEVGQVK